MKRNLTNKIRSEKAIALLALNAERECENDHCLLTEEMAGLIDNSCDKEQLAKFMLHVSCCDKCYEEWCTLKKLADAKPGKGRLYRFSRRQKYSCIGSAFAVAASVAVFLNISQPPVTIIDKSSSDASLSHPAPQFTVEQLQLEHIERKGQDDQVETVRELPGAPPVMDALPEKRTKKRVETSGYEESLLQESKEVSPAVGRLPAPAVKKMVKTEAVALQDSKVVGDVDAWLKQLKESCIAGRRDAEFWSAMHLQGKTILEAKPRFLSSGQVEKVSAVLAVLDGMAGESVEAECRRLLAILAKEDKSR